MTRDARQTVVAEPTSTWVLLGVASPLVAAAALWLFKAVAGWVAGLPAAPMQGWFGLASGVPEPWATAGALTLGALAGLAFTAYARYDSMLVTLDDTQLTLHHRGDARTWHRSEITAAFRDGGDLVILGKCTEELARQPCDLDWTGLARALQAHRYPWRSEGDPHEDAYRRWVPGLPDVPAGADALFTARGEALRDDDGAEAAELRSELGRLGLVVRDDGTRQYWRKTCRENAQDSSTAREARKLPAGPRRPGADA